MAHTGSINSRIQLVLAAVLLLVLVTFIVLQGEEEAPQPFDPASAAPTGLRALWLWLEAMEYRVERNDGATFAIPDNTALIFVFPNQQPYTIQEAYQLKHWVAAGGTLVIIGPSPLDQALRDAFLVETGPSMTELLVDVTQQQPLLPDLTGPLRLSGDAPTLDLSRAPATLPVLTSSDGQTTLALQRWQHGVIWHVSPHHNLTNEQLRDPAQATLVPALLRHAPAGSVILFDTYHLFGAAATAQSEIQSLQEWLYRTPLGWAVLFMLAVTVLFLLLNGQRLGPPLPTREELRRREAAEYVTAMANLLRRGQQRAYVAAHHKQRLKRTLGRALNVSPDLADAAFLRQVQQADDRLSAEEMKVLATLFQTLSNPNSEQIVTQSVSQIEPLVARYRRRTPTN